jgi:hypothetical protein
VQSGITTSAFPPTVQGVLGVRIALKYSVYDPKYFHSHPADISPNTRQTVPSLNPYFLFILSFLLDYVTGPVICRFSFFSDF